MRLNIPGGFRAALLFIIPLGCLQADSSPPAGSLGEKGLPEAGGIPACEAEFFNTEYLSNLTNRSVTVSFFPKEEAEFFVEYGFPGKDFSSRTETKNIVADGAGVFQLGNLDPGETYRYRLRCKNKSGDFGARPTYRFKTFGGGSSLTFAFVTDSHIFSFWTRAECGRLEKYKKNIFSFSRTMENIALSRPDFMVMGGDSAMTHCPRCIQCATEGESTGEGAVKTLREAELRNRITRNFYEPVAHSVPVFRILGNHEGEAGFTAKACGHEPRILALSLKARQKYFPVQVNSLGGGAEGNYFAFESANALFLVLDVMRYTTTAPVVANDWTLGEGQLGWLKQTLKKSNKEWKFLFLEHLVGGGGLPDFDGNCGYYYGRGGLRTTDNGNVSGTFLGEQAIVHRLMKEFGARFLFYGHDHIFSFGEKQDREGRGEGIYYSCGGRASGLMGYRKPKFSYNPAFLNLYDLDDDGEPDIIREPGFTKVTIHPDSRVTVQYIKTDYENSSENGKIIFDRDISLLPGMSQASPSLMKVCGIR